MIGRLMGASAALMLSGCAFQQQVHRYGVDYNEALSSMTNEQTLLNILRASKGMPTHFSSVNRFNGTLSMKASGSMNGALRGSGLTTTDTTGSSLSTVTTAGTSNAPTGLTTNNSVVTTPGTTASLVNALAEGVDVFTPQIGGEFNSGTGFEVQVFDQQKFYQGILTGVPFTTVEMLLNQGFEPDLVANLLIARVDLYREDPSTKGKKDGDAIASYRNDASDRARFQWLIDCNALDVMESRAPATKIAPISRLELGTVAGKDRITLEQLALFDGDKFGLSEAAGISPDGSTDATVYVVKPGAKSRVPKLVPRSCDGMPKVTVPSAYAKEARYLGDGEAEVSEKVIEVVDGKSREITRLVRKKVILEIVFRSPEAVLRAVGEMVRHQGQATAPTLGLCAGPAGGTDCKGTDKTRRDPVFEIERRRDRRSLVSARFMGEVYSVSDYRSMQVISIIQQLINLQKESTERALSIPVRALP